MILQKNLIGNDIMTKLPTRLRRNPILRKLIQETRLSVYDLVQPVFVTHSNKKTKITSMPGQHHIPLNKIVQQIGTPNSSEPNRLDQAFACVLNFV